jgi:hypothetical protein
MKILVVDDDPDITSVYKATYYYLAITTNPREPGFKNQQLRSKLVPY